jgi:hypothetical protein
LVLPEPEIVEQGSARGEDVITFRPSQTSLLEQLISLAQCIAKTDPVLFYLRPLHVSRHVNRHGMGGCVVGESFEGIGGYRRHTPRHYPIRPSPKLRITTVVAGEGLIELTARSARIARLGPGVR